MRVLIARNAAQSAQCELCKGCSSQLAALAKPSSSLQGCLPPLPEEALDRPREYWTRAAFVRVPASHTTGENLGQHPGTAEEPGSLGAAKRIAAVATHPL